LANNNRERERSPSATRTWDRMGIIIVAEDDFIMSEYLSGILTEKGYSVIAVANANDAIAMFEHRDDVRMLISDINMPGSINGLNLAATVRERWPQIKIIITTGQARPKIEEVPEGSLYLRKPYTPGSVMAAVLSLF
jgi:two-component system, response regulator PdtaR